MTTIEQEKAKYEQVWKSDDYRKFSPGLKAIQDFNVLGYIKQDRITSVLDVGCGSGKAMQHLMLKMPSLRVHGFDIAENCLDSGQFSESDLTVGCLWEDALPGNYDMAICTDVFEHIPTNHLRTSIDNIHKAVVVSAFFCIALFPDSFGPKLIGEPLHLSLISADEWLLLLEYGGFTIDRSHVVRGRNGTEMWLYAYCKKEGATRGQ